MKKKRRMREMRSSFCKTKWKKMFSLFLFFNFHRWIMKRTLEMMVFLLVSAEKKKENCKFDKMDRAVPGLN